MPISERELRSMNADLADVHHETLPAMHESLREHTMEGWVLDDDVEAYDFSDGVARLTAAAPSRRMFLAGAGALLGGAVLLKTTKTAGALTRRSGMGDGSTSAPRQQKLSGDLAVVALAAALENLAVGTYQAGIDAATAGKLGAVPPAVVEFATTAQAQHKDHAAAWNGVLTGAGKKAVSGVDLTVKSGVDTEFAKVTDVAGLAKLALTLENVAAQTYLGAIDVVKSPAGIKTAATIEPVELQHAAILNFILGQYPVPDSFTPTADARPPSDKIG
jgi:hypothetical protein